MEFSTRTIHRAQPSEPETGSLIAPIFQTSTYEQHEPGVHRGFDYSRTSNPTRARLEAVLADLEGVTHAAVFASGLAAENAILQAHLKPGDEIVISDAGDGIPLGLTVCYDLRFPELFRILAIRGARVITLPAAFTKVTGQAHWEILIRSRAIENQAFVVAADQIGTHPPDKESFGGSMIVDPWGDVLARAPDEECFIAANLDFARQDEVRDKLPSLANRVASAYRWPDEVTA